MCGEPTPSEATMAPHPMVDASGKTQPWKAFVQVSEKIVHHDTGRDDAIEIRLLAERDDKGSHGD
jgi:hypothetical protein